MTNYLGNIRASTLRSRNAGWSIAGSRLAQAFARYRNRRDVRSMQALSDHLLGDIGLTRSDLRYALRGGPLEDPSADLTRAALRNRSRRFSKTE
ncbi:DUF1127 domain-containing protein [Hoeflea poritis]|uniref:DUF1127 domain-containing protein n=1 Tax=Hoeflea poritis TaxID=2993659 RepID=A0ABT4VTQ1_9HYPH|nr:DUF1127 domain-containing protein [Hoeflea poritis]MDA4848090.1 DUF1127 domain-containing protein [Hoeflea poritis]